MSNYWAIKRFKDEPILVTQKVATQVGQALQEGKEFIVVSNQMINSKSISAVEETREPIPDENVYLLGDGNDGSEKPSPVLNLEGAVITNWYKKAISSREWATYYKAMSSYTLLQNDGNGVWIAWRRPEMYNDNRSTEGIEPCTKEESDRLWKMEMSRAG